LASRTSLQAASKVGLKARLSGIAELSFQYREREWPAARTIVGRGATPASSNLSR
jgi:hypothetical protein